MSDRHVFGELVLVPSRRALHRSGGEIALIPRTLDLLLLIRRRDEAIGRREILDTLRSDVVVSEGALSQAVRTLRRALGGPDVRLRRGARADPCGNAMSVPYFCFSSRAAQRA